MATYNDRVALSRVNYQAVRFTLRATITYIFLYYIDFIIYIYNYIDTIMLDVYLKQVLMKNLLEVDLDLLLINCFIRLKNII